MSTDHRLFKSVYAIYLVSSKRTRQSPWNSTLYERSAYELVRKYSPLTIRSILFAATHETATLMSYRTVYSSLKRHRQCNKNPVTKKEMSVLFPYMYKYTRMYTVQHYRSAKGVFLTGRFSGQRQITKRHACRTIQK